jgi:hypothetical protein
MENYFLTHNDIEQLINASGKSEMDSVLASKKGNGNETDSLENVWATLMDYAPECKELKILLYKNDFHNLKAALKSMIAGREPDSYYIKPSNIELSELKDILSSKEYERLPEYMRSTAEEAYKLITKTLDGQLADSLIDCDALKAMQKEAIAWMGRQLFVAPLWLYPQDVIQLLGTDAYDEIQNRQQTELTLLLSPGMIYNMHKNAQCSSDPYPADEYLNDVFATVWQHVNTANLLQDNFRRQLQRTYVQLLGRCLNPTTEDNKASIVTTAQRSDAILYIEQHLDDVEHYLQRQSATGFTGRHYQQLLQQIKKIREKYVSGK